MRVERRKGRKITLAMAITAFLYAVVSLSECSIKLPNLSIRTKCELDRIESETSHSSLQECTAFWRDHHSGDL